MDNFFFPLLLQELPTPDTESVNLLDGPASKKQLSISRSAGESFRLDDGCFCDAITAK